jgi:crotonobetaine/carnitine-CoA ligase
VSVVFALPIPGELQHEMERRWGCTFVTVYGLSEAAPVTKSDPSEPLRPGSAGKVNSDYYDVRIFDEYDREVPTGTVGEVVIRPKRPHIMFEGYYRNPAATLAAFRNLWFHSGDLGRFDGDGYFYFVDREKDYLRRRGENISSFEVEAAIRLLDDVVDAAVVGVSSRLTEQEVKAVVAVKPGITIPPEDFISHCIEHLPYFAVPRYVQFVTDLPRTPSGKIEKFKLRAQGTTGCWDREAAGIVLSGRRKSPSR